MKKTILHFNITLILLCASQVSYTQTYTPFPDSNAVWSVLEFATFLPSPWQYYTIHYGLFGDTVINTISYNKLFSNDIDSTIRITSLNTKYNGALRQEILNKKVYYLPKDSINEILLYNFNLNVGDTFFIQPSIGSGVNFFKCVQIDSILMNNKYRKAFVFLNPPTETWHSWVEGMGNFRGLLYHWYYWLGESNALCFYNNDTLVYHMDSLEYWNWPYNDSTVIFSGCYYNNIIISNPVENNSNFIISAFPNPFTNNTEISIPEFFHLNSITIEIFDLHGRRLKSLTDLKSYQFILKREDFIAAGVYFVRIKSAQYLETIKLIVQ